MLGAMGAAETDPPRGLPALSPALSPSGGEGDLDSPDLPLSYPPRGARVIEAATSGDPADEPPIVLPDEPPIVVPIDGTLDLHTFRPSELSDLLPAWLEECRERGILEVRVIHGKGTGALRRSVEALLARSPLVSRFGPAGEEAGGWGATLATLRPGEGGAGGDANPGGKLSPGPPGR